MLTAARTQVQICNMALKRCGIKQVITSLDPAVDTSQEAASCAEFWDVTRQNLLAAFPWKFATRLAGLQEFVAAASEQEHLGSGTETLVTDVTLTDVVGTYNVLFKVTGAGAVNVGKLKCSLDGGVTWGTEFTYIDGGLDLGTDIPVGAGLPLDGTVVIDISADATLVVGDIYRLTITDGASIEYTYAYALPADLLIGKYLWPGARNPRADQRTPWKRGNFGTLEVLWSDNAPEQTPTIIYVEDVTAAARFPPGFANVLAWRLAYEISGPLKAQVAPLDIEKAYLMAVNEARSVDFIEAGEDQPPDSVTVAARGYNWSPYGVGTWPPGGWFPF